jgi:cytochrome c oxidase assembly protein subunit 15
MSRSKEHPWLNRFACLTGVTTFLLLGLGGLVTSKGVGMAVPDWPTTYGYNMFLFPFHLWTGGIFYEHTHRLFASFVGLLTTVLAVWLWLRESRAWLRWLGIGAFFAVVLQGVLGGLRVTLYKDQIGVFHAALAQLFFVTVSLIALVLSQRGVRLFAAARECAVSGKLRALVVGGTILVFAQLVLGATMRHQHAGLAVPDFPLAYGRFWPPMDSAAISRMNQQRVGFEDYKPITATQIALHMAHRMGALAVLLTVSASAWVARRDFGPGSELTRLSLLWLGLIGVQAVLGAATVWSNKAADVATAHVLVGALSLFWGTMTSTCVLCSGSALAMARKPCSAPGMQIESAPSISGHKSAAGAM